MRTPLLVLALLVPACSSGGEGSPGQALYKTQACHMCHGETGAGGSLGPPLHELATHWSREQIAEYLGDPLTYIEGKPRLLELKGRYPGMMPRVALPLEQRLELADYVLELSARAGD